MCYGGDSQKGSLLYIILLLLDRGQRSLLQSKSEVKVKTEWSDMSIYELFFQ
jgi:hypothetical protein